MELFMLVILFFLGASFASFINVLAGGDGDLQKNLKRDRSICESCKKELRWWELIPVLSWFALGGKCARCSAKIPVFHTVSEIILGGAFVLSAMVFWPTSLVSLISALILTLILYFFSIYDLFHGKVRNAYLYPIIGVTVFLRVVAFLFDPFVADAVEVLAGALWYFAFFAILNVLCVKGLFPGAKRGKKGFGWGDVKYGVFLGLVLGWPVSFIGLWLGIFLGGFVAILVLLLKKGKTKTLPFVPFMSAGAWVALLWGDVIMELVRNMIML